MQEGMDRGRGMDREYNPRSLQALNSGKDYIRKELDCREKLRSGRLSRVKKRRGD